jgi:hypothetical protein
VFVVSTVSRADLARSLNEYLEENEDVKMRKFKLNDARLTDAIMNKYAKALHDASNTDEVYDLESEVNEDMFDYFVKKSEKKRK